MYVLYLFNISEYKVMLIKLLIYHINIDVCVCVCVCARARAKDQEGQTTGVGHPRGMWLQWRIVHMTLSHEIGALKTLHLDFIFISFILRLSWTLSTNTFSVSYLSCRIVLQIKNIMLTRLLVNHLLVNIAYIKMWVHLTFVLVHLRKKVRHTSAKS